MNAIINIIVYKCLGELLGLYPEGIYLAEGKMKQKVQAFLTGISILSNCPPLSLYQFVLLTAVFGSACFPTNSPALCITKVSHFCQSDRWTMVFYCCFDLYFFINCIFSRLWTIYLCWSYWVASSCALSFSVFPIFILVICKSSWYKEGRSPFLWHMCCTCHTSFDYLRYCFHIVFWKDFSQNYQSFSSWLLVLA